MEVMLSPSSSYSPPSSPPSLQYKLQCLLNSQPEWWTYSIFWQASTKHHLLSFADGHFRGSRDSQPRSINGTVQDMLDSNFNVNCAMERDKAEWFYDVSLSRSFAAGGCSIPSRVYGSVAPLWITGAHALHASGCERSFEAQMHGIQTLVCIPVHGGVLELGSSDLIGENWVLILQAKALLSSPPADNSVVVNGMSMINSKPALVKKEGASSVEDLERFDSEERMMSPHKCIRSKKCKRKPGSAKEIDHVEAERQRREKLNHRFYSLRSVVPNVSRMDKASLLSDAVSYIKELKAKVEELEGKEKKLAHTETMLNDQNGIVTTVTTGPVMIELEVKLLGSDALIRLQSENLNHPTATLMGAIRDIEMHVHHASVLSVKDVTVQDVVVRVPSGMQGDQDRLKAALLRNLKKSGELNNLEVPYMPFA